MEDNVTNKYGGNQWQSGAMHALLQPHAIHLCNSNPMQVIPDRYVQIRLVIFLLDIYSATLVLKVCSAILYLVCVWFC